MSTRYDSEDILLSSVISGLASQPSPKLPDFLTPINRLNLSLLLFFNKCKRLCLSIISKIILISY